MMDFEIVLNLRTMSLNCTRKLFSLTSCLYSYLYQYNVPNISILQSTAKFWFDWLKCKWLWLIAGKRYLECDGVEDVGVLDEDGGLTVRGEVGGRGQKNEVRRRQWVVKPKP